jgi:hypothetical protein
MPFLPGNARTGELGSPDILEFGHFRFDRRGRCLYRLDKAGTLVLLPAGRTALDLLDLLVERAGEVVESEEIRRAVWRGKTVEDANLATQIFHLRESVGRSRIQTVSGVATALSDQSSGSMAMHAQPDRKHRKASLRRGCRSSCCLLPIIAKIERGSTLLMPLPRT